VHHPGLGEGDLEIPQVEHFTVLHRRDRHRKPEVLRERLRPQLRGEDLLGLHRLDDGRQAPRVVHFAWFDTM